MIRLTETLWVLPSRSMAYNAGAIISGGEACLIDPGPHPDETAALAELVERQGAAVRLIVLTHSHWDHILGPERLPPAPVIAHAGYPAETAVAAPQILRQIARWEERFGYARAAPFVIPPADRALADGAELDLGGLTLRLIHIPGHAADQIAVYLPGEGALWAADTLSDLEIPFVSDSLAAYGRTLQRMAGLTIRALVPGHGAATTDQGEIRRRVEEDRRYLAELRDRVGAAVGAGGDLEAARAACAAMGYRHPDANAPMHRLNVESAFIELGGAADPRRVGWAQEGLDD